MINLRNISFQYVNSNKPALKNINLTIKDGEFILITGNSGSGKSTLVRTFNGLIPHFYGGKMSGSIEVNGKNPIESKVRDMAEDVGYVFQIPDNQIVMNIVENEIVFGMENLNFPPKVMKKRLEEILDSVGIAELRERNPHSLSGGEKQKVTIASILCLHPKILVLDEPTSELDPKSAEEILIFLQKLNAELGMTIILIEHRTERILPFIDRIILMKEGSIILDDDPNSFFTQPLSKYDIAIPPIIKFFKHFKHPHLPLNIKESREILRSEFGQLQISTEKYENQKSNWLNDYLLQSNTPIIETKNIQFSYNRLKKILKGIDLTFKKGEFVAIIGRNGSGKTTLLKTLNGLLTPKKGSIVIQGKKTKKVKPEDLAKEIGFLFQNPSMHFFQDTVYEEIEFSLKNFGVDQSKRKIIIEEMLEKFGLEDFAQSYPRYLSVGEQQRVALASIMIYKPSILLLDEPTHGMDYNQKRLFFDSMKDFSNSGGLVILVSHDIETIARYAHRVILLSDGQVVVDDEAHEVLSEAMLFSPQINRLIQGFSHIPNDILNYKELISIMQNKKGED